MLPERDQRVIPVRNGSNEVIPAFACMRIKSFTVNQKDGQVILIVDKPSVRSESTQELHRHCFNLSSSIPRKSESGSGGYGDATMDFPVRALVENEADIADAEVLTGDHYSIIAHEWFVSRKPRIWRAMPALQSIISTPQGERDEGKTILAMPVLIHPPLPSLRLGTTHNAKLTTTYQTLVISTKPTPHWWHSGYYWGGWSRWGYGWGWGWSSQTVQSIARYGLEFNETKNFLRVGFDGDYQIGLSGWVTSETDKTVTVAIHVNGKESLVLTTWGSTSLRSSSDFETLALAADDLITLRGKISANNTGSIDLRGVALTIIPVFDEDGTETEEEKE